MPKSYLCLYNKGQPFYPEYRPGQCAFIGDQFLVLLAAQEQVERRIKRSHPYSSSFSPGSA